MGVVGEWEKLRLASLVGKGNLGALVRCSPVVSQYNPKITPFKLHFGLRICMCIPGQPKVLSLDYIC